MTLSAVQKRRLAIHGAALALLFGLAVNATTLLAGWQGQAAAVNFFLGFLLLSAHATAQILKVFGLPLITGYILAGILSGPHVFSFLDRQAVAGLRLADDLALGFIGMAAGAHLSLDSLKRRAPAITVQVVLQTAIIFAMTLGFCLLVLPRFSGGLTLSGKQVLAFGILMGILSTARSPSSAIAIISETKARGRFTDTVLGVTVVMDVVTIVLFTLALTVALKVVSPGASMDLSELGGLSAQVAASLAAGIPLGLLIRSAVLKPRRDAALFLLFTAFAVAKTSAWLEGWVHARFGASVHIEPLLVCMSAGFVIQNFTSAGRRFIRELDRFSLPVYLLFFSLAGASLDLSALAKAWPLALALAAVRAGALVLSTWFGGLLTRDPARERNNAWMSYLAQAGVAIGLAKIAENRFPEMGAFLTTVVLSVITLNQVAGPVTFKWALRRVGESAPE